MRSMSRRIFNGVRFCSCCGKRILFQGYIDKGYLTHIMESRGMCYDCAYWTNLIEYPPKHLEVLDGKCLIINPHIADKKDKSVILGGKGCKRWFVKPGLKMLVSNDIWNIGTIPERFRDKLPDTVYEITEKAYKQIRRNPKWCTSKGCLDRYHCFRYDLSLEEKGGPYNKIPKNWKIGDEHCGFRFGQEEVLSDDSRAKTLKTLANGKENK